MTDPSEAWLESAHRQLRAAGTLHSAGEWPEACFHTQQAVEIALKAAIAHRNIAPPRLHSLPELLAREDPAVQQALNHLTDELRRLNRYYTPMRYSDAMTGALPGQQEADEALKVAHEAVGVIEGLIYPTTP